MKRTIAIVAGGDSSELPVSLRSAQGIYSFMDKEKYDLFIVEIEGHRWETVLPDGTKVPVDRNDFSFQYNGEKKKFDFAYITHTWDSWRKRYFTRIFRLNRPPVLHLQCSSIGNYFQQIYPEPIPERVWHTSFRLTDSPQRI